MIKIISKAFQVGDRVFATAEEAQVAELDALISSTTIHPIPNLAKWIVENKAKVLDILTTKANSRPVRRKVNRQGETTPAARAAALAISDVGTSL